jgi:hypothetical protein
MCYAKPGPRCASELSRRIAALDKKRALYEMTPPKDRTLRDKVDEDLHRTRLEYYGTPQGQAELADQIAATTDPDDRHLLNEYRDRAAREYADRVEAAHLLAEQPPTHTRDWSPLEPMWERRTRLDEFIAAHTDAGDDPDAHAMIRGAFNGHYRNEWSNQYFADGVRRTPRNDEEGYAWRQAALLASYAPLDGAHLVPAGNVTKGMAVHAGQGRIRIVTSVMKWDDGHVTLRFSDGHTAKRVPEARPVVHAPVMTDVIAAHRDGTPVSDIATRTNLDESLIRDWTVRAGPYAHPTRAHRKPAPIPAWIDRLAAEAPTTTAEARAALANDPVAAAHQRMERIGEGRHS